MLDHEKLNLAASEPAVREVSSRPVKPWVWFLLSSAVFFVTLILALDNTIVADL